jgi:hypothetical protein
MKQAAPILLTCLLIVTGDILSQQNNSITPEEPTTATTVTEKKKKLNFFVISKRKKGALDLASRFNVFRAKMKSLFRRKKFVAIVAKDGQQASAKIRYRLEKYNGRIGTLWFDSHGMYKKGYSLFFIGKDEYSYKTLKDSTVIQPLQQLAPHVGEDTKIIIGSCYGGATYTRSSIDYKDTTRMNGDSLMIGIGEILGNGNIYACESWVMTKPGLFLKKAAVAGYPGRKLFRDVCYKPAWENVSKWNHYNVTTDQFSIVNPVTMDMYGNLMVRKKAYTERKEVKKEIRKKLENLEAGLYK